MKKKKILIYVLQYIKICVLLFYVWAEMYYQVSLINERVLLRLLGGNLFFLLRVVWGKGVAGGREVSCNLQLVFIYLFA